MIGFLIGGIVNLIMIGVQLWISFVSTLGFWLAYSFAPLILFLIFYYIFKLLRNGYIEKYKSKIEGFKDNKCLNEIQTNKELVDKLNKQEEELLKKFNKLLKSIKIDDVYKNESTKRIARLLKSVCVNENIPNWGRISKILNQSDKERCISENIQISNYITNCRDKTIEIIKNEIKFLEKNTDKKFIENYNKAVNNYENSIKKLFMFKKRYEKALNELKNKTNNNNLLNKFEKEKKKIFERHGTDISKIDKFYNSLEFKKNNSISEIYDKNTKEKLSYNIKKIDKLINECNKHHNIFISLENYIIGTLMIKLKNQDVKRDVKKVNYPNDNKNNISISNKQKMRNNSEIDKSYDKKLEKNKNLNNIFLKPKIQYKNDKKVYNQVGYSYTPPESWIIGDSSLRCSGSKTGTYIESGTTGFPYDAPVYINKS